MNLNQQLQTGHECDEVAVDTPQFIVDGILVTGATSNRTLFQGPISRMLISCLINLFRPGTKLRERDLYQSVIVNIEKTPLRNKRHLRVTAQSAKVAIERATGFTVPGSLKKYSLNFLLQYHHVRQPDVAEYIKVTTLTSNDKHKFRLVALVLADMNRKRSWDSLAEHNVYALDTADTGSADPLTLYELPDSGNSKI